MTTPIKVFLRPGKEIPILRFHPWVFSGAIAHTEGRPEDGDIAEVFDKRGNLLGVGHFHHGSIAVRLLSFGAADLESENFWVEKLQNALSVRKLKDFSSAFRLVHGEGDGLSGLILNVYENVAVIQFHNFDCLCHRAKMTPEPREVFCQKLNPDHDNST